LYEMKSRNIAPLAIIFNSVNPILVQGAAQGDISMLSGFTEEITQALQSGQILRVDPGKKMVEVIGGVVN